MSNMRFRPVRAAFLLGIATSLAAVRHAPAQDGATKHPGPAVAVRIVHGPTSVRVLAGQRVLLEYCSAGNDWKTYAAQLCTPAGINVLQVAPPDHVHHRGLIFALGADDIDFWGEHYVENPGVQRGGPVTDLDATADANAGGSCAAGLAQVVDWIAGTPERVRVRERRQVHVERDSGSTLLTWRSELTPGPGRTTATLWGRPYFGLAARFAASMDRHGRFVTPDGQAGEPVRGDERLMRADWCAYRAAVDGAAVTVAMFGHPDNPRQPTTWFTMAEPFALLAATLDLANEPLELRRGETLRLCYGVALWDGEIEAEQIEARYRDWLRERTNLVVDDGRKAP